MSPGKHGPNRLLAYVEIHNTIMRQLLRAGFVLSDELALSSDGAGGLLMTGKIRCLGGIYIDVNKHIARIGSQGQDILVQTVSYRYNVVLEGHGNIFRHDSPHPTHHRDHHVHRYDVLAGDTVGSVEFLYTEDAIPTLQEVIHLADEWYYANLHGR